MKRDDRTRNADDGVIFLHLPKAAGTTLREIVQRQFADDVTLRLSGRGRQNGVAEFLALPEETRARIRFLTGHMPYGLHRFLSVPARYITVLRDPVDRVVSLYSFILRTPTHYIHEKLVNERLSLSDFVSSGWSTELSNDQTRMLSGVEDVNSRFFKDDEWRNLQPQSAPVTSEILQIAKNNIRDGFAAVGLFDRFDEFLLVLQEAFGWRDIHYVRQNVTPATSRTEIAAGARSQIEQANVMDMQLYEYVRDRVEEDLRQRGPLFARKLRKFQRSNALFQNAPRVHKLTRLLSGHFGDT